MSKRAFIAVTGFALLLVLCGLAWLSQVGWVAYQRSQDTAEIDRLIRDSSGLLQKSDATEEPTNGTTVYVTDTGECYHAKWCRHLRYSKHAILLKQAKQEGYRACSVCGGG